MRQERKLTVRPAPRLFLDQPVRKLTGGTRGMRVYHLELPILTVPFHESRRWGVGGWRLSVMWTGVDEDSNPRLFL